MAHIIMDFIIEYFQGIYDSIYIIMYRYVGPIFPNMRKFLFLLWDVEEDLETNLKKSVFMKK